MVAFLASAARLPEALLLFVQARFGDFCRAWAEGRGRGGGGGGGARGGWIYPWRWISC